MTTTADKIRALPDYDTGLLNDHGGGNVEWWQDYLRAEIDRANDHWREQAAALVEAEPPQDVRVKPDWDYFQGLVNIARRSAEKAKIKFPQPNYVTLKIAEEAGEVVRGAVHYAEGRMEWDEVQGEIVQLLAMLIRFVTEGDEVNGIKPPDLVTRTPPAVDASPAPDPVSPTPTLDAMAMRREVVGRIKLSCDLLALNGYAAFADRVMELIPVVEAITLPADAALAEAMKLPEVKALVEAAESLNAACDAMWNDPPSRVKERHSKAITEAQQALFAALKGVSHE